MPKQKITEEMVVQAAFDIAREHGVEQVLVKNIALRLGCSVQPIYSYCESMDGLRQKLVERTGQFLGAYLAHRADPQNPFRGVGLAHLSFAREEPRLFKLYFLRKRSDLHSMAELYARECSPQVAEQLSKAMGITPERARQLHTSMMLHNVGICAIMAMSECDIPIEQLEHQLSLAYDAFCAQALSASTQKEKET